MHYGLPTQQLTREDAYCVRLVGTHFLHPHDQSPGGVSLKAKKIAQHKFGVAQSENMAFLLERLPHLRAQVFVDAPQVLQSIVCALASPTCHIISCAHENAVDGLKRDPQQKKKKIVVTFAALSARTAAVNFSCWLTPHKQPSHGRTPSACPTMWNGLLGLNGICVQDHPRT